MAPLRAVCCRYADFKPSCSLILICLLRHHLYLCRAPILHGRQIVLNCMGTTPPPSSIRYPIYEGDPLSMVLSVMISISWCGCGLVQQEQSGSCMLRSTRTSLQVIIDASQECLCKHWQCLQYFQSLWLSCLHLPIIHPSSAACGGLAIHAFPR